VETAIEEGRESIESNYVGHPIVKADSPPIQRIDKGGSYGRLPSTDRGPRTKRMASKHPHPKYYTILYLRVAYIVSSLRFTLLQPPYKKRPDIY
jgi:hypothetical protein